MKHKQLSIFEHTQDEQVRDKDVQVRDKATKKNSPHTTT
jgi:hypothetical protein